MRREAARALAAACAFPFRAAGYALRRARHEREVRADLASAAAVEEPPEPAIAPDRPLRVFVAAAETSGEIHAVHLVRALRRRLAARGADAPAISGIGGERLEAEGVETIADPIGRASMGFEGLQADLGWYLRLLERCAAHVRDRRIDVLVPVDSPALHVPMGRIARRMGARVAHLVTPQYWGWAPWRVRAYRDAVDVGLSILPFEPAWFARHGVRVAHVGHPLLDALADVPATRPPGDGPLALLPGSRAAVVERNLPWMLRALARARERLGGLAVVLPHARAELAPRLRELVEEAGATSWVAIEVGDLHAALARARSAFSVSGTALLDLLHHRLPTVVVYRLASAWQTRLQRRFLTTPWFASPNLLANEEVVPEFCFDGEGPIDEVAAALVRAHADDAWRSRCLDGLDRAAGRLGPPGATDRAAGWALATLRGLPPAGARSENPAPLAS